MVTGGVGRRSRLALVAWLAMTASAVAQDATEAEDALTSPRLIEAPPLELPEGAEPLPEGASVELVLTLDAQGAVTAAELAAPVREDVDALALAAAGATTPTPTSDDEPIEDLLALIAGR